MLFYGLIGSGVGECVGLVFKIVFVFKGDVYQFGDKGDWEWDGQCFINVDCVLVIKVIQYIFDQVVDFFS